MQEYKQNKNAAENTVVNTKTDTKTEDTTTSVFYSKNSKQNSKTGETHKGNTLTKNVKVIKATNDYYEYVFDGCGIRQNSNRNNYVVGDTLIVEYAGTIGKPDFTYKIVGKK